VEGQSVMLTEDHSIRRAGMFGVIRSIPVNGPHAVMSVSFVGPSGFDNAYVRGFQVAPFYGPLTRDQARLVDRRR